MTTYVEEFVAKLGFEIDGEAIGQFEKRTEKFKKTLGNVAKAATIAAGAITGIVAVSNRGTARVDAMARSVGVSTENILALTNAIKPLGFEVDNVVDLVEEMNNKIGESTGLGEPMTAVAEATRILGIEYGKLRKLAPEEQFFAVLDAALALEDTQQAVSAVDMLTGGEGNKILGFLRAEGKGIREVVEEQKRLNLLTEDGIEGAIKFDRAFLKLTTTGKSLVDQFSGKLGDVLGPLIDNLVEWIVVNEDLIQSELTVWAKDVGEFLVWIFETVRDLVVFLGMLVEKIGGLRVAFRILLVVMGAILALQFGLWVHSMVVAVKALVVAVGGLSSVMAGLKLAALGLKWLLIFGLVALIIEDLIGFLQGKDSVIGDLSKEFENLLVLAEEFWSDFLDVEPEIFRQTILDIWESDLGEFFTMLRLGWGEVFSDIGRGFVSLWERAVEATSRGIERIADFLFGLFDEMVLVAFGYISTIGDFVTGVWSSITGFFTSTAEGIRGTWDSVVSWVLNKVGTLVNALPGPVKELLGLGGGGGTIKGVVSPGVKQAGTGLASGIKGLGKGAVAGFRGLPAPVPAAAGPSISVTVPTNLNVTQKGSMTPEELTRKVSKAIGVEVSKAVRNNSEGVAY